MSPPTPTRRHLLGVGALTVAAAAAPASAQAQAATRTVTKQVAVKYVYDPATGVTTVTKFRAKRVTARFVGRKVFEKRHGKWVRMPYVWDRREQVLVYSRRLHLKLLAAKVPASPTQPEPPNPQTPVTSPDPSAPPPSQPPPPPPDPGDPIVTTTSPYAIAEPAHHVLNRVGYGVSVGGLRDVREAGGAKAWLAQQLKPDTIDDSECDGYLRRLPDQSDPIWQVSDDIRNDKRQGWEQLNWVNTGMIVRAAWSRRQLLASLDEFWGNHFNVTIPHDDIEASRAHYQWTIRTRALSTFEDLLVATSTHPAMLTYLNNRESDDEHPNENQGRELLELHSVGLEAGYTEDDVLNSARILTGLSVDQESGEFEFKPWRHWTGPVRVLGFSHDNPTRAGGLQVALAYLKYLAAHPATARRIAGKLARRFVSDAPSAAFVDKLVEVFQRTGGNIAAMLEFIFASQEFWGSAGGKTRRPFDGYIATLRRLDITPAPDGIGGLEDLTWLTENLGQSPFGAPYPTGWPEAPQAWASPLSTLNRWNATLGLADSWPDDMTRHNLVAFVFGDPLPTNHGAAVDALAQKLTGRTLIADHRQSLLTFLGKTAASPANAGSAIYGWRLPHVAALILDSPYLMSK